MPGSADLPLTGILVLDFSQFLAGPVAALRLADLGARVVKIERPHTGEIGRTLAFAGRWADGDTLSFHAMNRGKEAVIADLKAPDDLAAVQELVARADVLIQNFRPGVMERIGLDHASAHALNPGLVYASASGYGTEGPWAGRPGQDLLAQSVSGLTWASADRNRPVPVGLAIADHLLSCHLAEGVTALLVRKARTGRGGLIETSLLEAVIDLQSELLTTKLNGGTITTPGFGVHETADGYLAVAGECDEAFGDEPTAHWLQELGNRCTPVLTLEELLEHPGFTALRMTHTVRRGTVEITTTRSPIRIDGQVLTGTGAAAPRLGAQGHVRRFLETLTGG